MKRPPICHVSALQHTTEGESTSLPCVLVALASIPAPCRAGPLPPGGSILSATRVTAQSLSGLSVPPPCTAAGDNSWGGGRHASSCVAVTEKAWVSECLDEGRYIHTSWTQGRGSPGERANRAGGEDEDWPTGGAELRGGGCGRGQHCSREGEWCGGDAERALGVLLRSHSPETLANRIMWPEDRVKTSQPLLPSSRFSAHAA